MKIIVFFILIFATSSCGKNNPSRIYCSDKPICDKYICEDMDNKSACELWEKYCEQNPNDKNCGSDISTK